ncbi:MAG: transketolase [Ignavibacterium sp.]|nr:transketolase [Ignavibacterium sp.]MDW8376445.1 transketolase [Ignavibacteriales bacterium]
MTFPDIEILSINTIRTLSIDAVQKANSGHPGMPLGCAPIVYHIYKNILKHNPSNPSWVNRDRFILSAGHGSMLLYSILHLCGYDISIDDIKSFRQWGSKTPGHPEYKHTPGVEVTTGPLGQGFATAIGMAIAREYLASIFNEKGFEIFNHYVFCLCSDGDLMEGISHEAASFAGHQKLSKLICFYDDNGITIDGNTSLSYSDDVEKRFQSYNWNVFRINDVNNLDEVKEVTNLAIENSDKPVLIISKSIIGYGSPNKQNSASAHGAPLGKEEVLLTKKNLNWNYEEEFFVPDEVKNHFENVKVKGIQLEKEWNELVSNYSIHFREKAILLNQFLNGDINFDFADKLPTFEESIATRQASGKVLSELVKNIPFLIGGSADLSESNNTYVKDAGVFSYQNRNGRNIHFGVREHAMAAIMNGMALHSNLIPYGGTFLIFSDYMRPSIRLAALMGIKVIYVFTHDSIGLGEDGPTHQPIEQLSSLRAIPNLVVIRPADANEVVEAWKYAVKHKGSPIALILTRQKTNTLDRKKFSNQNGLHKGAYILKEPSKIDLILLASGSEVDLAIKAAEELEKKNFGIRVVSFPSWQLFEMQDEQYKNFILPTDIKNRIVIEAGRSLGWEKYICNEGLAISIETFGASAPEKILFEKFGFTVDNVVNKALQLLNSK